MSTAAFAQVTAFIISFDGSRKAYLIYCNKKDPSVLSSNPYPLISRETSQYQQGMLL
jgi:hypothetical protein